MILGEDTYPYHQKPIKFIEKNQGGGGGERGVFFLATVFITFTKSNLSSKHREHILWREKNFQDITKYFQVSVNI